MPGVNHQHLFKNVGKSGEDLRRRRAEGSVELRKTRKDGQLMKRRNIDLSDGDEKSDTGEISSPDRKIPLKPMLPLSECMDIFQNDRRRFGEAVESVRRWLSRQANPAIDDAINSGVLPYLIEALDMKDPKIQFEAAWALTNISSGTSLHARMVISCGGLNRLVHLLYSDHVYVAEQACWALGNIAGDCAELRDIVIENSILEPLTLLCSKAIPVEFVRTMAWTISNLCRNKDPMTPEHVVPKILPIVSHMLDYKDQQVMTDACWAAAYLSDTTDDRMTALIDFGLVPKMVQLIQGDAKCIPPALRCLGNIVTGNDQQTQTVIDTGVLNNVVPVMSRSRKSVIVKETMWLLSNIVAGTQSQIQAVLDAGLIKVIIDVILNGDPKPQHEACWVIANLFSGASAEQIAHVVGLHTDELCRGLSEALRWSDSKHLCLALECIYNLLTFAARYECLEKAVMVIEEVGGLDRIESLQSHSNEDVYHKSLAIIDQFFHDDDDHNENTVDDPTPKNQNFEQPAAPIDGFQF